MSKIEKIRKRNVDGLRAALLGAFAGYVLWGCGGATQHEYQPCADIHCNGHGSCVVVADSETCSCDSGYHTNGLSCLLDPGTQPKGWQLDANNTGLAGVGINRNDLPLYEPPSNEIEYGLWHVPAGTHLNEKKIVAGGIDVAAGDITFERCWFYPASIGRGLPLIYPYVSPRTPTIGPMPTIIRDSDIDGTAIALNGDGTNPACGSIAINSANIQIERCNIYGFGSGVGLSGQYEVKTEGNYIHDLVQGEWILGSGESHQDGFTIRGFSGPLATIRNNRILVNPPTQKATGPLFLQATWTDSFFDNLDIEGNLLEGYGYCLALEKSNGSYGTNLRVIDNRFDSWSGWTTYVQGGPGWAEWRENYQNDPAQTDNKGALVAEPLAQANSGLGVPSNLQVTTISSSSLRLSWSDNSGNEVGFRIGRSSDGVTFTSIDMAAASTTSYIDTTLSPNTTYYYRIAAANGDGISEYSNVASAATASP